MSGYGSFLAWFYSSTPVQPGAARNAPTENIKDIPSMVVSKADLDKTKLRHVEPNKRKKHFAPRSPVLQEILNRAYHRQMRSILCEAIHEYYDN